MLQAGYAIWWGYCVPNTLSAPISLVLPLDGTVLIHPEQLSACIGSLSLRLPPLPRLTFPPSCDI